MPPTTPTQSEEDTDEEIDSRRLLARPMAPIPYPNLQQWAGKDVLQDAINEAKTFENLVRHTSVTSSLDLHLHV